jgi:sugar (pentulose or hexulose) kinase
VYKPKLLLLSEKLPLVSRNNSQTTLFYKPIKMKKDVIAIFDIGKTHKKILLFDSGLKLVFQTEEKFAEITDEDGFSCDDIAKIETWMIQSITTFQAASDYNVKAINFATYGASLAYLDSDGQRITPIYNYLKPMPDSVLTGFYEKYGGVDEFSRKTASPASGMLNSGLQILWLKKQKPELFNMVKHVLHFPQYLSFIFTKNICSEFPSIGCHTSLWDFDKHSYHQWLADENIELPVPVSNDESIGIIIDGQKIQVGIGIHDSSSSLAPYLISSEDPFILISTGTWCIFMNPFNDEPLTAEQLSKDALCYMSTMQKQVKSARLFMGHIHDVNAERIATHFGVKVDFYKSVKPDEILVQKLLSKRVFFRNGVPADSLDSSVDLSAFTSYEEAYHQLIIDLTYLGLDSLQLVIPKNDTTRSIYVTGGFARNEIFVRLLAALLPWKSVFTSEIDNATALGAAMVLWNKAFTGTETKLDLGLKKIEPFALVH